MILWLEAEVRKLLKKKSMLKIKWYHYSSHMKRKKWKIMKKEKKKGNKKKIMQEKGSKDEEIGKVP